MANDREKGHLSRRDFLRRAAAGAAGALAAGSALGAGLPRALAGWAAEDVGVKQRVLGRTGLKVSELGLGTIKTENEAVIHRALDLGINFFDTAECYQGGNSEVKLGKALKGRREEAVVATKWHTNGRTPAGRLLESLDQSLKRLEMEYVDIVQIHGATRAAEVESDELWEAFTRARKSGKVGFNGLSTHGNIAEVVRAAIESDRYDQVLMVYNAMYPDLGAVVGEAKEANVGVVIMKALQPAHEGKAKEALGEIKGNAYQQALQWVLRDRNVSTVVVDMPTFEELEEGVAAASGRLERAEVSEFERAVERVAAGSCRLCGACTGQCPRGVQVADIMRYRLYHDGYGDRGRARELYRALPTAGTAAACLGCAECRVVCPWGVPVRSRLERAHVRLA